MIYLPDDTSIDMVWNVPISFTDRSVLMLHYTLPTVLFRLLWAVLASWPQMFVIWKWQKLAWAGLWELWRLSYAGSCSWKWKNRIKILNYIYTGLTFLMKVLKGNSVSMQANLQWCVNCVSFPRFNTCQLFRNAAYLTHCSQDYHIPATVPRLLLLSVWHV